MEQIFEPYHYLAYILHSKYKGKELADEQID